MVREWLQPSPFERFHPEPSSTGLGVAPGNPSALQGWCSLERCPFANQCHIPCDSFASSGSLFSPGCSHHAGLRVPSKRDAMSEASAFQNGTTCASKIFQMRPILPTNSNIFCLQQHHILQLHSTSINNDSRTRCVLQPSHGPG